MTLKNEVFERAREILPHIRTLRQKIHEYPELAYNEKRTSGLVVEYLEKLGISCQRKVKIAKTGILGMIIGKGDQKSTVALRADMDALQKTEKTRCPYSSKLSGCMHACGHDGHVALLLGCAEVLQGLRDKFSGTVKLIFQPGEETGTGGKAMIEEGVMKSPPVDMVFALHGWPSLPCGTIGIKSGQMMAAASEFVVEIFGSSAHAAAPHKSIDPVVIAAQIITALQNIRSRIASPNEESVISVTILESGNKPAGAGNTGRYQIQPVQFNIIPEVVRLKGTTRALSIAVQERQLGNIEEISHHIARAFGARSEFAILESFPPTINDPEATRLVAKVGESYLGKENVIYLEHPSMGAEDFSYYLKEAKGSYFRLGLATSKGNAPCLHSDGFDFNDEALLPGIVMMSGIALEALKSSSHILT